MRLTLTLLGWELDLTFGPSTTDEPGCSLDGGTTYSTPVGFMRPEVPWEDPGSLHQFEPEE